MKITEKDKVALATALLKNGLLKIKEPQKKKGQLVETKPDVKKS